MKLLKRLINIGVDPGMFAYQNRPVRLTNVSALVGMASYLGFGSLYILNNAAALAPALLPIALAIPLLFLALYLNFRQLYLAASLTMNLAVSIPVFLNLWFFFGPAIGNHYLFILFALLPVVTLDGRRRWLTLSLMSMNLAFFLLILNHQPVFDLDHLLGATLLRQVYWGSSYFGLSLALTVFYVYQQLLYRSEIELNNQKNRLTGLLEEVQMLATKDAMTGISNRRVMEEQILSEITRAERYHQTLSMVLFDLDLFKTINDTLGHDEGDEVLKNVVRLINGLIRTTDYFGRWGGEEFLILLPQTQLEPAGLLAEKLRRTLAAQTFPKVGRVTASFGVAEWMRDETFESFYKRVDEALYQAKTKGRNRVARHVPETDDSRAIAHFHWNPEWDSGDPEIDNQHKELIEIANEFVDLSQEAAPPERVLAVLDRLLAHVSEHFNYEEQVLNEAGFQDALKHKHSHSLIINKALGLKESYLKGEARPISFFVFIIEEVVMGHLLNSDVKYFMALKRPE